jgi:D-glutamate cyclase
MNSDPLDVICAIIQEDAGNRGLRTEPTDNLITATAGDFRRACQSLAETPRASIAIVTGFFIPHGQPPCAETDGPLGAVFLARALIPLGIRVVLASDAFCIPSLEAGLKASGLSNAAPPISLPSVEQTAGLSSYSYWQTFVERSGPLTHMIALERVGPSHTLDSIQVQAGRTAAVQARYLSEAPVEHHDRCHTMRGRDITDCMSPAHRLFEEAGRQAPRITTFGIGDGGNEIGMGKISWEVIRRNIKNGGLVACRVPTDQLIVCGISNWGAYGLAAGVRLLCGAAPDPELFDLERERRILKTMVERGPLVDGMSGEPALSVDGFAFEQYAEPLSRLALVR